MSGGTKGSQQTKRARERRISVRAIRREEVDVSKLARALIALAQVEAEAQAEHQARQSQEQPADE